MTIDTNLERHGLAPNRNVQVDVQKHEITNSLNAFTPVTSERNVWFFWDKGFEAMPPWIQRSVINCVKRHDKSWTFRLLNLIPNSPNHVLNYVKENDLPATAINGQMIHAHAGQHISDFVRLAVVYSVRTAALAMPYFPSLTDLVVRWYLHRCGHDSVS